MNRIKYFSIASVVILLLTTSVSLGQALGEPNIWQIIPLIDGQQLYDSTAYLAGDYTAGRLPGTSTRIMRVWSVPAEDISIPPPAENLTGRSHRRIFSYGGMPIYYGRFIAGEGFTNGREIT